MGDRIPASVKNILLEGSRDLIDQKMDSLAPEKEETPSGVTYLLPVILYRVRK
ncbi:hypothetical protein Hsar01_01180 [Haloferula sargassicola]|uniref:Uncharacterized protein n=1 Tax=Haloferula sargassicola TaxID=490096 RepID=A0ABP9UK24_9BACT